ncbi:MAG TPA: PDZ domain-containing protein [Terriglobales bacterium]|nr:PDZ domain-containing protein [Terriglobales bacterium]
MVKSFPLVLIVLLLASPTWASGPSRPEPWSFPGYGEVHGSYLGVDLQEVTSDRLAALKLKEERGAEITMVDHDSPAGRAGLKEHDVILEFNGTKVQGTEELRRLIHETPPGRNVQLLISRDGQPMNISLQLADKKEYFAQYPATLEAHEIPIPAMPPIPPIDLTIRTPSTYGLLVENLTPQLGEYFGVKNGEGVLVKSVEAGTPAKAAGFKAGDVIVRVNNQKIADRGDWRSALRANRSGKVTVGIVRERREQNLTLNLPESSRNRSAIQVSPEAVDIDLDMEPLLANLEQLRPELHRWRTEALGAASEALKNGRKSIDVNEKELKRAMDQAKKALDYEMKRWQKELEKAHKEAQRAQD